MLLALFATAPHAQAPDSTGLVDAGGTPESLVGGPIPTAISYQGVLADAAGTPVPNASYTVTLRLFAAAAGGSAVYAETHAVSTVGGAFAVPLGGGTPVTGTWAGVPFGEGFWLETAVGATTLSPRAPLLAAPYARGLTLPYAATASTTSTGFLLDLDATVGRGIRAVAAGSYGIYGETSAPTNIAYGGYFRSESTSGRAVYGIAPAATGTTYGVYGTVASTSGRAVSGVASAASGATYGGYFTSSSATGYGLYANNSTGSGIAAYFGDRVRGDNDVELYDGSADTDPNIIFDVDEGGEAPSIKLRRDGVTVLELDADHNGDARVITQELEITGGSDLAEHFDVTPHDGLGLAQPGMVVSIDPVHAGRLAVSATPYDRLVAGVVSGAGGVETGLLMGQRGSIADGETPVALVGRVYVLVDADQGAVRPGDLLTTSATPGHAMRAADRERAQGAVLGKAMTALESGRGLVLVLVGLQ